MNENSRILITESCLSSFNTIYENIYCLDYANGTVRYVFRWPYLWPFTIFSMKVTYVKLNQYKKFLYMGEGVLL